jgi:hypothetical protein
MCTSAMSGRPSRDDGARGVGVSDAPASSDRGVGLRVPDGPASQDGPDRMVASQMATGVSSARNVSSPVGVASARDIAARSPGAAAASGLSLHPEALEDLRRSGLSDATIAEAGLYTPAPGDLPRLLSARLVDKVRHVLVFPYEVAGRGGSWRREDEFVRCKLFPSVSDGQGHTIRYYQRAGTPPRL